MSSLESVFYWSTALFAAIAFFLSIIAITLNKSSALKYANYSSRAALITLTIFGITRWAASGHPPFVTLFESMTMSVWFILLVFQIIQKVSSRSSIIVVPISLVSFLLLGWSASLPVEASPLSAALDNVWLFIHASFATAGAATFVIASSFSAIYLLGEQWLNSHIKTAEKIPEYKSLPKSILNFVILGLILWGVMIVSGSIWAHNAWGRYWAWDPIELWSLISWLLYGLVLHSRMGFKVSPKFFAWLTIIAALTVIFALWGVGYVYQTIHVYG